MSRLWVFLLLFLPYFHWKCVYSRDYPYHRSCSKNIFFFTYFENIRLQTRHRRDNTPKLRTTLEATKERTNRNTQSQTCSWRWASSLTSWYCLGHSLAEAVCNMLIIQNAFTPTHTHTEWESHTSVTSCYRPVKIVCGTAHRFDTQKFDGFFFRSSFASFFYSCIILCACGKGLWYQLRLICSSFSRFLIVFTRADPLWTGIYEIL